MKRVCLIVYFSGGAGRRARGILTDWDQFGPIIKEMRVRLDQPQMNIWFEYLVEEMKKIREKETGQPWKPVKSKSLIREET